MSASWDQVDVANAAVRPTTDNVGQFYFKKIIKTIEKMKHRETSSQHFFSQLYDDILIICSMCNDHEDVQFCISTLNYNFSGHSRVHVPVWRQKHCYLPRWCWNLLCAPPGRQRSLWSKWWLHKSHSSESTSTTSGTPFSPISQPESKIFICF